MLQRSIHGRLSMIPLVSVFFSCLSASTALALLPARTRGTTTSQHQLGKSKHDVSSLSKIHCKSTHNFAEDELITPETTTTTTATSNKSLTRHFFLSSVCSRSVSVIAATATTGVSVPQIATAMVTTDCNSNNGDSTMMTTAHSSTNSSGPTGSARVLTITLRSLPVSGCWAVPVTVSRTLDSDNDGNINNDDFYTYLAVVDTGSPFLTAPISAFPQTTKINVKQQSFFSWLLSTSSFRNTSTDKSESDDLSYEQYGDTVGSVNWRMAPYLTLIGNGEVDNVRSADNSVTAADNDGNIILKTAEVEPVIIQDQTDFVLGIPSEEVVQDTGGIFLGLMTVDASRPTPLQQLGYDAFVMRFRENIYDIDHRPTQKKKGNTKKKETMINPNNSPATLVLWDGGKKQSGSRDMENSAAVTSFSLIDRCDPYSMQLFSFTPYGPNIHHYGVLCDRFECSWGRNNDDVDVVAFDCDTSMGSGINSCTSAARESSTSGRTTLSRPLVAVFDTGLSGCIFSDTLWEEIRLERQRGSVGSKNRSVHANNDKDHRNISRNDGLGLHELLDSEEPIGCTVWLPTIGSIRTTSLHEQSSSSKSSSSPPSLVKLSSISNYWRFQSYRLPWWYADSNNVAKKDKDEDTEKFPHVVVLGSTFWRNPDVLELAVDTTSKRGKIRTMAQHR